jgi:formate/nitrite transporter FocA (FNT family)
MLGLCYLGNFLGGLLVALMMLLSTLGSGPVLAEMEHSVSVKLGYIASGPFGWSDLFFRAVLCNLMINVAMLLVYNGFIKEDVTKALAMITAVFIFAFLGLEHSVANTILFTIVGLKSGIDLGLAAANVAIALVGNFIGGGVLIGFYYAFVNDDSRYRA